MAGWCEVSGGWIERFVSCVVRKGDACVVGG